MCRDGAHCAREWSGHMWRLAGGLDSRHRMSRAACQDRRALEAVRLGLSPGSGQWSWTRSSTALCFAFLVYKMDIMTVTFRVFSRGLLEGMFAKHLQQSQCRANTWEVWLNTSARRVHWAGAGVPAGSGSERGALEWSELRTAPQAPAPPSWHHLWPRNGSCPLIHGCHELEGSPYPPVNVHPMRGGTALFARKARTFESRTRGYLRVLSGGNALSGTRGCSR